jgi:hypothetical protein
MAFVLISDSRARAENFLIQPPRSDRRNEQKVANIAKLPELLRKA